MRSESMATGTRPHGSKCHFITSLYAIIANQSSFVLKVKIQVYFCQKSPYNGKLFQYYNFGFGTFTFNSNGIYASS